MSLLRNALTRPSRSADLMSIDDYAHLVEQVAFGGHVYSAGPQQTLAGQPVEPIGSAFVSMAQAAYASNGIVFACLLVRQLAFSSVRFQWQMFQSGRPSKVYGDLRLGLLEKPWPGGTTQDLLARMIQDADLSGNAFVVRDGSELVRLRPDWVDIVVGSRAGAGGRIIGYAYYEGGRGTQTPTMIFTPEEVAHFAPTPDPLASYRGMSWLTPIIREIQADKQMTIHKGNYLTQGATPNIVIKHPVGATQEAVERFARMVNEKHAGYANAYKTMNLYPGADLTVVGSDMKQMDFKTVQGAGETRIAAAARVPPVLAGFSEGLSGSSLNQGNYQAARRAFADGTMHPLWSNAAGCLQNLMGAPMRPGERLWYDASSVPLLREDEKDLAEIQQKQAATISTLIAAGFDPPTVIEAVDGNDWRLLTHTGMVSVQLMPPGESSGQGQPAATDGSS